MYKKIWQAIVLVYRLDKKKFIINYGLFVLQALISILGIYLLQLILAVFNQYLSSQQSLTYLLFIFGLFVLSKVVYYFIRAFSSYYCEVYDLILRKEIRKLFQKKKIAPIHYEEKAFLDLQEQALLGANKLIAITNAYIDLIFMYGSELLFLTLYLYFINPLFIFIILFIVIVQIFNDKRSKHLNQELENKIHNLRRKKDYYAGLFLKKESVKEIKILNNYPFLKNKLFQITEGLLKLEQKFAYLLFYKNISFGALKLVVYSLSFIFVYIYRNQLDIAQFTALFLIMESIFKLAEQGFTSRLEEVNQYLPQLQPFFTYLEYEEIEVESFNHKIISLDNVSFRYPNSEKKALENISLVLEPNEKVGIVGRNGSGKSTLVKIIAGIYEPTKGTIKRKEVSVVMQDFMKYELSVIDNVAVGQITKEVDNTQFSKIDFQIEDYDKIISKEFSDIDLSQGQWQKLAILRGLHKESEYLIFDEPTWAIDPFVEKKVFDYLKQEVTQGMLIVTHNLTSVQMMDKILVLDEGKIVGFDTHKKLLATNKWYQSLWNSIRD